VDVQSDKLVRCSVFGCRLRRGGPEVHQHGTGGLH
jgi:hypothetical protein